MRNHIDISTNNVLAIKVYKDGGQATMEYFQTTTVCLAWIAKQKQPKTDEWYWAVGTY